MDVIDAMRAATDAVRACAEDQGTVVLRLAFTSNGCLQSHGVRPPGEAGSQTNVHDMEVWRCVERATAAVRLRPFSQEVFKVSFPYKVGPR
ncbi:MAG: hypothetical protein OEZ06_09410 [Myxococcales bacterium]|nr:hypothetical protein [Myxococcales bacterium]